MTSRERINAVLEGKKPDRVPIDFCGTRTSGISAFLYPELRDLLGLEKKKTRIIDVYQMLALPDQDIIERMHSDVVLSPRYSYKLNTNMSGWKPYTFHGREEYMVPSTFCPEVNETGDLLISEGDEVEAKMPAGGYYFDYVEQSYSKERKDIDSIRFETWTEDDFSFCEKSAKALFTGTDKALIGDFGMSLGRPSSFEAWMLDLGMNPNYLREYYDKKSDHIVNMLKMYKEAVDPFISIIFFGQDFGTQNGEMISPNMFSELIAPYYKKIFTWIHENTSWKVFHHTCGSVTNLIESFIDCGVDILNPVQTSAVRMEPESLKKTWGGKIIFWGGGVDTQSILPFGTPDEVREQVQERLLSFGREGGYVFTPIHNIQKGVPPENIAAAFDAAYEYGSI